jgi:hypothetical protein
MTNEEQFTQQKYTTVNGLVPTDLCRVVTKYALLQEATEFTPELGSDAQVENAHSKYADTLMETLLFFLRPHIEKATGRELCPTYSYYRVYRPGMKLDSHRDRPSCEISTTICFGFNYILKDEDYRWGMYIEPGTLIAQDAGDAIIYQGCEVDHWREVFDAGPNSYQIQAFFHYIDKNGPFYPNFAYDARPSLGFRKDQNKANQIDK